MNRRLVPLLLPSVLYLFPQARPALAADPPLLPEPDFAALAAEVSGEAARRELELIARLHRMRGSRDFRAAADHIVARLGDLGLDDARVLSFPADGVRFYGTQRSRPAWEAEFAELWELAFVDGAWRRAERIASFEAMPLTLAQDSVSGTATTELVDAGAGTGEADYAGREVRGKLILVSAQPGAVAPLAVGRFGAAGIVSYAPNQRTAWWKADDRLVRWGHLEAFDAAPTFAFMVSLRQARTWQERLARGERVRLEAEVRAERRPGSYDIATAVVPGVDPRLRNEEIVWSCHLDHPRPGANDNASGCAAILEVARSLAKLVREGRLAPPRRTLRFVWPPEIEGTLALLAGQPEWAARVKAAIHLDMVGGAPETKAVFHVTRGPASLPSVAHDVAEAFAAYLNEETYRFAATGESRYPLHSPEGGREPLQADLAELSLGSDHQVYAEGSWRIPAIYLNDWPDRYIHTNFDLPAHIDPTKLKRAALVAAASGYLLASLDAAQVPALQDWLEAQALRRAARTLERRAALDASEAVGLTRFALDYERELLASIERFAPLPDAARARSERFLGRLAALLGVAAAPMPPAGDGVVVYRRASEPKGPMAAFGYGYFEDRYGAERAHGVSLLSFEGARGDGEAYAYEVLNLVDGRRSAQAIRDFVSAELGPVPLALVVEYLRALESIGVVFPVGR